MNRRVFFTLGASLLVGCSPLRTSHLDERYQLELTIHEVQTNLDDLRHDTNCFQTEIQILDGRLKSLENALVALKQESIEKQQSKLDQIASSFQGLEKKWAEFEEKQGTSKEHLDALSIHSKESDLALYQCKMRLEEMERGFLAQNKRLEVLTKLKDNMETLAKALRLEGQKTHKVKPGDTLEKIAKLYDVDVQKLRDSNRLSKDLIIVDQELQIP